MIILSSVHSGLEFGSINHTSIYENSELNVIKNINVLGEISNNWPTKWFIRNKCIEDSWIMFIIVVDNITMD